jgi:hypothetical protein
MRPGVLAVRPLEGESLPEVDRTCPICKRPDTLVPFGVHQNLQVMAVGEWRLVTVEIAQCRHCRSKISESLTPEIVTEAFWKRVERRGR